MAILIIQILDKDRDLFEGLSKRPDAKILEVVEEKPQPNIATKRAVSAARLRKTKKIDNLDLFFKGL